MRRKTNHRYGTVWFVLAWGIVTIGCGGKTDRETEIPQPDIPLVTTVPKPVSALSGGATVLGTVTWPGTPPPPTMFTPNKDTEICGTAPRPSDDLVVGPGGGIANVVVSIVEPALSLPMDTSVEAMMDQKGCVFIPHVARVASGAPMTFLNNDGMLHNIHTSGSANPSVNRAQPGFMKNLTETFATSGIVRVQCDVHGWMSAYVVVQEHPFYATTDVQGGFTLTHVPAGVYTLRFWHERLGERFEKIEVKEGQRLVLDVTFPSPVPSAP
ncbi:MAG: hypothetical protein FJY97_19120 [candidate division Zixibacteria bacterium]|nr:hypothetical protein [candidate division Zixibacteria bacterium]